MLRGWRKADHTAAEDDGRFRFGLPTRTVRCPHCGASVEVARRAISARCSRCTAPMRLEDAVFNCVANSSVSTLGDARVLPRGLVYGQINCGSLYLAGRLNGEANVRGHVEMKPKSAFAGLMRASSVQIPAGATFEAELELAPRPCLTDPAE